MQCPKCKKHVEIIGLETDHDVNVIEVTMECENDDCGWSAFAQLNKSDFIDEDGNQVVQEA